jgi:hypothetical protein
MKRLNFLFAVIFCLLLSTVLNGQTKSGYDFFAGGWKVFVGGTPMGDVKMVVSFEKINSQVKGSIQDSTGKQMFEVLSTEIDQQKASVNFMGSQGEVPLILEKKDDDHLTGNIMGMFDVEGVRIRGNK